MFDQQGMALLGVLLLIVLISITFTSVLMLQRLRFRQITNNRDYIQARYNAEAAAYTILDSLSHFPDLPVGLFILTLPWGDKSEVEFSYFGGFIQLQATGYAHKQKFAFESYAGVVPQNEFEYAMICTDTSSPLTFAGNTTITGDIVVGNKGIQYKPFQGNQFTGKIDGKVITQDSVALPIFFDNHYRKLIEGFNKDLISCPNAINVKDGQIPYLQSLDNQTDPIVFYSDKSIVFSGDSPTYKSPVYVISKQNITLSEDYKFSERSVFCSQNGIIIKDNAQGKFGLFYSPKYVIFSGLSSMSAQAIAGDSIIVKDGSRLNYPSVLYLYGSEFDNYKVGLLELSDSSYVAGTLIYNPIDQSEIKDNSKVIINKSATVEGVIYSENRVSIKGKVKGSAVTYQFHDYYSTNNYINWLISSTIDVNARRKDFLLPLFFSNNAHYDLLTYKEVNVEKLLK
jgi:hypothetical protein